MQAVNLGTVNDLMKKRGQDGALGILWRSWHSQHPVELLNPEAD
jgi:hypothetical protein